VQALTDVFLCWSITLLENTDKCHSQKTSEQVPVQVAKDINVLPQIFEREAAFQWRLDGEDDDGG